LVDCAFIYYTLSSTVKYNKMFLSNFVDFFVTRLEKLYYIIFQDESQNGNN